MNSLLRFILNFHDWVNNLITFFSLAVSLAGYKRYFKKKEIIWIWVCIGFLVICVISLLGTAIRKNAVEVPDVIGHTYEDACHMLSDRDLNYTLVAGDGLYIISQNPVAGIVVKKGTIIELEIGSINDILGSGSTDGTVPSSPLPDPNPSTATMPSDETEKDRPVIPSPTHATEVTTPTPETPMSTIITGNSFSGNITEDKQVIQYTYEPPVSGIYRFDFDIDSVESSYKFAIDAANGENLASANSTNGGKTVELSHGEKYDITVKQSSGKPQYTVKIGIPNEVCTITDNNISGTLNYQDQTDNYLYTAPLTGQYRFDFISSDVTCNYKVLVRGSNQEDLASTNYSNRGKTLNLSEGETYSIAVKQSSGYPDYDITIGLPNAIQTIEGNSFSGSITYADQLDRYLYTAPITGTYRFDFVSDDVQNDYRFYMYKSDNTNLASTHYANHGKTVDLEAGETYRIEVKQSSGTENYTINIGIPNIVANVEGDSISGNITYTDQEDSYSYTPPATGKYLFSFGTNDAATDYRFYVISAQNEDIASSRYNNSSKSVELVGGQTYTIKVKQSLGFPAYQIDINFQE